MEEKYYIGDLVVKKGSMERHLVYFLGSERLSDGSWRVNFTFNYSSGYAGHGANMYLIAQRGDRFRFGKGYEVYKTVHGFMGGEKMGFEKMEAIIFDDIEKDCITLGFE